MKKCIISQKRYHLSHNSFLLFFLDIIYTMSREKRFVMKRKENIDLLSYLDHLVSCINSSFEVAKKESSLLPEHERYDVKDISEWYKYVLEWIEKNPPEYYVKYIEVTENFNANITSIHYIYFDRTESVSEAAIKVTSELYDT